MTRRANLPHRMLALAVATSLCLTVVTSAHAGRERAQYPQQGRQEQHRRQDNDYPQSKSERDRSSPQQRLSAQEAANQARSRYGGKVLKVSQQGSGYRVRLLQNDGRVITVAIEF